MFRNIFRFFGNILKKIFKFMVSTAKEIITNIQAVVIMSFGAIGLTTVLKELPFHFAVPALFDGVFIIPIISIMTIFLLAYSMTWGNNYAEESI